jgi:hypothetical protein
VQDQQTVVDDYIDSLAFEYAIAQIAYHDYVQQYTGGDSPAWRRTLNRLLDRRNYTAERFDDQYKYCILDCNARCRVNCGFRDMGACFTDYPRNRPCFDLTRPNCALLDGGVFFPGRTCPGACWASAGGVTACFEIDEKSCRELPSRANIPGRGSDMTILAFCPLQLCNWPMCSQPVP